MTRKAQTLVLVGILGAVAPAAEPRPQTAEQMNRWIEKVYQDEYVGYKFELPPTVRKKHPRLPYPSEEVCAFYRQDLKERVLLEAHFREHAMMLYVITGEKKYLEQVCQEIRNNRGQSKYQLYYCYDWFYDELPADVKKICLDEMTDFCQRHWEDPQEDFAPTQTFCINRMGVRGMPESIVIWGETPEGDEALRQAHRRFFQGYLPIWHVAMGPTGGGFSLPAHYYVHGIQSNIVQGLQMWGRFLGEDLWKKYDWVRPFGYQPFYLRKPDYNDAPLGDANNEMHMAFNEMGHLWAYAKHYDDPYMRRFAYLSYHPMATDRRWLLKTEREWWYETDPRGKPLRHASEGLPTEWLFDGWGLVAMRSDWSEDATYGLFKVGDVVTNHTHNDSGMFYIYKHGPLAEDTGRYTVHGPHQKGYTTTAIAHNVVTVRDPADKRVPNDGGQRACCSTHLGSPASFEDYMKRREIYETGDMLAYDPNPEYVYAAGDVTAAYQNKHSTAEEDTFNAKWSWRHRTRRLERMTRAFLYIRPDVFAVFDRVAALDPAFEKRWLLHTTHKPEVRGRTVAVERNDLLHTKMPMFINRQRGSDSHDYQLHGKLFCKTLLPRHARIDVVGGPGKWFWVDGKNYDEVRDGPPVVPDPTKPRSFGGWRIEVRPTTQQKEDLFLHVIQVGDSGKLTEMAPVEYLEAEGRVGFTMAVGPDLYRVLFDSSGVGGHIDISRDGETVVDRDFATILRPNRQPAGETKVSGTVSGDYTTGTDVFRYIVPLAE